jgi:arsenate reductase
MGGAAVTVTIYHNPRCTKSRETLALLKQHGIEPRVIEYLKATPSALELKGILKKLGLKPRDIIRDNETRYAELRLKDRKVSDDELLALIAANPILLQRPIVVNGNKAAIGRPPENVLSIL